MPKILKSSLLFLFTFSLFFLSMLSHAQTRQSFFIPPGKYTPANSFAGEQDASILLADQARLSLYGIIPPPVPQTLQQCLLSGEKVSRCLYQQCPSSSKECFFLSRLKTCGFFFVIAIIILVCILVLFPACINGYFWLYGYLVTIRQKLRLYFKQRTSQHTLEDILSVQPVFPSKKVSFKINKFILIEVIATLIYSSIFSIYPNENLYFYFGATLGNLLVLLGLSYFIARISTPRQEDRPLVAHTVFWILLILIMAQKIYEIRQF